MMSIALIATAALTSCQSDNLDDVKNAQMCLNHAAPADAQGCVSNLSSNTTPQADQLKCAAYFIQENFGSPTALITAIDQSKNATTCTGCSSSLNIVTAMSFSSETQAQAAFDVCNASGVDVYAQLSSIVQIATLAKQVNPSASTPADFSTAIASLASADLGNLVLTTYTNSCSDASTTDNKNGKNVFAQYCTEMASTLTGATPTDVGACLKYKLTGNNYPGLPCPTN